MINSVRLIDFQSHKDNKLDFHPLFNIISGPSGNGKSSIMRAIKYTAFNNPGTSEVRWPDATKYQIELVINDKKITRQKGTSVNSYQIDKNTTLTDVNRDVPASVEQAINIKKVVLDTNAEIDIHFADQLDAPFMLAEKETVKMKFLNVLAGTNAVDLAAKRAVALSKDNSRQEKLLEEEIRQLKAQETQLVEQYEKIKQVNKYLKEKTNLLTELVDMRKPLYELKNLSDNLHNEYKKLKILNEKFDKIDVDSLEASITKYIELTKLSDTYAKTKEAVKTLKAKTTALNKCDFEQILAKIDKVSTLKQLQTERDALKSRFLSQNTAFKAISTKYDTSVAEYVSELNKAKICPICGNNLTQECIDNIINNL